MMLIFCKNCDRPCVKDNTKHKDYEPKFCSRKCKQTYMLIDNHMKGRKHSEKTKQLLREIRMKQKFPLKDTKIEKMVQIALALKGIRFETHKNMQGQPDIFIEPNICIFVDGCFWHCCLKCRKPYKITHHQIKGALRDNMINHELSYKGFIVIRLWEHEVLSDVAGVADKVMNLIVERKTR